ncbi:hypothetical protein F2P56_019593 [Juglans regia]|uniref:Uncharacterized protein n=1 Tax=Juglans regia TaxID=51240 RepID=A0A833U2L7_JUGRE|nr:hypothetical protein F2P56_019593 [Juglans regia]
MGFDFCIEYKKGKDNKYNISVPQGYTVQQGIILKKGRIVLVPDSNFKNKVLDYLHVDPQAGHTGLPLSNGVSVILVVVDRYTKYGHFLALSHPYTAQGVAQIFMDQVFKLHGLPKSIVSDRDIVFLSSFWKGLFELQGSTLSFSSAYHPQSDGKTEALNKCLETYLRCYTGTKQRQWSKWLPLAEYSYNSSYHTSTKISPFEALYGYPPPRLLSYIPGTSAIEAVDQFLKTREQIKELLKENLAWAQNPMKFFADQRRTKRSFEIGEWVYLRLQPYRQNSVLRRRNLKLYPRFFRPFKILQKLGTVAYRLELPASSHTHPIQLFPTLPPTDKEGEISPEPEKVVDRCLKRLGGRAVTEVLIKWVGAPPEDSTWELLWKLQERYPHLVGKVL